LGVIRNTFFEFFRTASIKKKNGCKYVLNHSKKVWFASQTIDIEQRGSFEQGTFLESRIELLLIGLAPNFGTIPRWQKLIKKGDLK
jgi:hypothetical protein